MKDLLESVKMIKEFVYNHGFTCNIHSYEEDVAIYIDIIDKAINVRVKIDKLFNNIEELYKYLLEEEEDTKVNINQMCYTPLLTILPKEGIKLKRHTIPEFASSISINCLYLDEDINITSDKDNWLYVNVNGGMRCKYHIPNINTNMLKYIIKSIKVWIEHYIS